jgi:hypothetical protein
MKGVKTGSVLRAFESVRVLANTASQYSIQLKRSKRVQRLTQLLELSFACGVAQVKGGCELQGFAFIKELNCREKPGCSHGSLKGIVCNSIGITTSCAIR